MNEEIESQLNGARNVFFGILKGIDGSVNIKLPTHVYHYTSWDCFRSMIETNSVRLYTTSNFEDDLERKYKFPVEDRITGKVTNNESGETFDFSKFLNKELSNDHVFIQSNTTTNKNKYLWKNYGDKGEGICLCFSTKQYINVLNETLGDFDLLPDYLKCCYISYSSSWADQFMEMILPAIQETNSKFKNAGLIVWFFFLEYWKNFIKSSDPYQKEHEVRFVVSENYSIFLFMCSLMAKWGLFNTSHSAELSEAFYKEYIDRKNQLYTKLSFSKNENTKFISVALDEILESITIGPRASFKKNDISTLTNGQIKKSKINKSFLSL